MHRFQGLESDVFHRTLFTISLTRVDLVSSLVSSHHDLGCARMRLLAPPLWPGNSFKAVSWCICRAHFIYFLCLRDFCSSLLDAQCLEKKSHFLYFVHLLIVLDGGG